MTKEFPPDIVESLTTCPTTKEPLDVPHGWYDEGQPTCKPCDYENNCWLKDRRDKVAKVIYESSINAKAPSH